MQIQGALHGRRLDYVRRKLAIGNRAIPQQKFSGGYDWVDGRLSRACSVAYYEFAGAGAKLMLYCANVGVFLHRQLVDSQQLNLVRIEVRDK